MNFIELMSANVVFDNQRRTATTLVDAITNVKADCNAVIKEEVNAKSWVKKLKNGLYSCTPNINKHSIFVSANSGRVRFKTKKEAVEALKALIKDIDDSNVAVKSAIDNAWNKSKTEIDLRAANAAARAVKKARETTAQAA